MNFFKTYLAKIAIICLKTKPKFLPSDKGNEEKGAPPPQFARRSRSNHGGEFNSYLKAPILSHELRILLFWVNSVLKSLLCAFTLYTKCFCIVMTKISIVNNNHDNLFGDFCRHNIIT